jgi:hypothetical protein
VIVLGGGLMTLWYFLVGPALNGVVSAAGPGRFIAVIYPAADLTLLVGLATILIRGVGVALTDTADPGGRLSVAETARELTHQADLAMYVAKRRGTHG